jgi:hypothetical protein
MAPTPAVAPSVDGLIRVIRQKRVILGPDLAALYGVPSKALNQAVRRNQERFPEDFMFILTNQEVAILRSQFVTSSWGGSRYLPMAFTEHGVVMLSAVLKSKQAIEMSIAVARAFVRLRRTFAANKDLATRVEKLESGQERTVSILEVIVEDLDRVVEEIEEIKAPPRHAKRRIGFPALAERGQVP